MMAVPPGDVTDPVTLLMGAHLAVTDRFGERDPLAQTALHLITCAAEVVGLLPDADVEAAREALGHARSAVTAATYAVIRVNDEVRIGKP